MSEGFRERKSRWGQRISVIGAAVVLVFGLSGQQALAASPTHIEINAGALPASSETPAKSPATNGSLTRINGTIGGADQEDLYRICVTGNTFSARTDGTVPGAVSDPQLFLFNEAGGGVARGHVANDDTGGPAGLQSTLPPGPNVPVVAGTGPINYPPGIYYLGISSFDHDPRDSGANLIFPNNFPGVVGPIAGAGSLESWAGPSFGGGSYGITLTGASTVISAPCGNAVCSGPPPPGAIVGTNGPDVFLGTPGDDIIFGLGGNDIINSLGGNDIVCGGGGNDTIAGDSGNDFIGGGPGVDIMSGGTGDDVIDGNDLLNITDGGPHVTGDMCLNPPPPAFLFINCNP